MDSIDLKELKQLLVDNCMLKVGVDEIHEDTTLFGPQSLGLDSLDAMQLTLAIEKKYGVAINDPAVARQVLVNLTSLQEWLTRQLSARK